MDFRKRSIRCPGNWYPRLKTKSAGQVDMVLAMFLLLLVVLMTGFASRVSAMQAAGDYTEDALAGALLASAVIDIEEYGKTGVIRIADEREAYGLFADCLRFNLQLETGDYSSDEELLYGKVSILDFEVYNVIGDKVERVCFEDGKEIRREIAGKCGEVRTPDGTGVDNTTVYGKIGFYVKGMFSDSIHAVKEKSIDIVRNEEKTDEKEETD